MLTVIAGGMFAEKSTELQRRGKRLQRAGKRVLFVKPDYDTRYGNDQIVTHDGNSVEAVNISTTFPIELVSLSAEYDVILIDEVQFFSKVIIPTIKGLLLQGKTVIVAGLDLDFKAEPFQITTWLMGYAEEVVKLTAVCTECGDDSWVSHKEDNGKRIELGTSEYKPLCRKCHQKVGGSE